MMLSAVHPLFALISSVACIIQKINKKPTDTEKQSVTPIPIILTDKAQKTLRGICLSRSFSILRQIAPESQTSKQAASIA